MKSVACFHCQDHLLENFGGHKLLGSWKYFYPDIPIVWYNNEKQECIKKWYPGFDFLSFNAPIMLETKLGYGADLVIFIDCDSILLDTLDEVFKADFDVASCKNDPDVHTENEDHNRPIKGIDNKKWVNAGFVAATSQKFLEDWIEINRDAIHNKGGIGYFKMVEQDSLNLLFHSGKFKTKILDENAANVFYGPSSQYITLGRKPPKSIEPYGNYFCESWLDINLKNGKPMLHGKRIPLVHACHGGKGPKLQYDIFNEEFKEYLRKITGINE